MGRLGECTTGLDSVKVRALHFWVLASGSASIELYRREGPQSVPDQYSVHGGQRLPRDGCSEVAPVRGTASHGSRRSPTLEPTSVRVRGALARRPSGPGALMAPGPPPPSSSTFSYSARASLTSRRPRFVRDFAALPTGGGGSSRGDTNAGSPKCRRRWNGTTRMRLWLLACGGHGGARSCRSSYARIRGSHRRRKPAYCGLGRRRGRRIQGLVGHAAR